MFLTYFLCLDFNFHQAVAAFDTAAGRYVDLRYNAADRCGDGGFHLHCFGYDKRGAFFDSLAFFNQQFNNGTGKGLRRFRRGWFYRLFCALRW